MRTKHIDSIISAILILLLWGSILGFGLYQAFFGPPYEPPKPRPTHRHTYCTRYNNQPLVGGGYYYTCEEN